MRTPAASWNSLPNELITKICEHADEPTRDALLAVNRGMLPLVEEARRAQVMRDQRERSDIETALLPMRLELHARGCPRPNFRNILRTCASLRYDGPKAQEYRSAAAAQAAGTWDPNPSSPDEGTFYLETDETGGDAA